MRQSLPALPRPHSPSARRRLPSAANGRSPRSSTAEFRNVGSISDGFGFDDLTVGSPEQVIPADADGPAGEVDPLASVAIIGFGNLAEVRREQQYLLAAEHHSRAFAPKSAAFDHLKDFSLILWNGAGRAGVTSAEISTLAQLRSHGRPLYFIGERLAAAAASLPAPDRALWQSLTRLVPAPGVTALETLELLPERLQYIPFGSTNLHYSPGAGGYEPAQADAEGQVVARAGGADVVVLFPRAGEGDLASDYRSASQNLFVLGQENPAAQMERQLLFQDVACWLLRCPRCGPASLVLESGTTVFTVATGETLEVPLVLYSRYACRSTGVKLVTQLPPELEWIGTDDGQSVSEVNGPDVTVIIGRLSEEHRFSTRLRLRSLAPGSVSFTVYVRSNESAAFGDAAQRIFSIQMTGDPPPPRLLVERTGTDVVLSWPDVGQDWALLTSPSLGPTARWTPADGLPTRRQGRNEQIAPVREATQYFKLGR